MESTNRLYWLNFLIIKKVPVNLIGTGNSLSEALIFASTNPQYDNKSVH